MTDHFYVTLGRNEKGWRAKKGKFFIIEIKPKKGKIFVRNLLKRSLKKI